MEQGHEDGQKKMPMTYNTENYIEIQNKKGRNYFRLVPLHTFYFLSV